MLRSWDMRVSLEGVIEAGGEAHQQSGGGRVETGAPLKVRRDVIVLVHGGPVSSPEDAAFIMRETKSCHGFYGASSMERLPTEVALTEQTRKFKLIGRQRG